MAGPVGPGEVTASPPHGPVGSQPPSGHRARLLPHDQSTYWEGEAEPAQRPDPADLRPPSLVIVARRAAWASKQDPARRPARVVPRWSGDSAPRVTQMPSSETGLQNFLSSSVLFFYPRHETFYNKHVFSRTGLQPFPSGTSPTAQSSARAWPAGLSGAVLGWQRGRRPEEGAP